MNHWKYNELEIGHKEKFQVTVTETMMEQFFAITADNNPLHRKVEFAEKKGFPTRVVYGMLTAGFLSTLAGVYLPGENSLIHEVETKFVKPVFPGDTLEIQGTVTECNDLFQQIIIKVQIVNQHGDKVLRGKMKVGVLDE